MTERIVQTSPRFLARITGVFFLLTIIAGIIAQGLISERIIVFSDAAATVTNISTQRNLFELGFTIYLVEMACQVAVTALFYELLRPVSKSVSLLAAFWGLTGCVIKTFARVFYLAPLFVLDHATVLRGFTQEQLQALVLLLLRVNDQGAALALAFFGFATVVKGYLIFSLNVFAALVGRVVDRFRVLLADVSLPATRLSHVSHHRRVWAVEFSGDDRVAFGVWRK
jgi:Domain of unknown function (DUF4386)